MIQYQRTSISMRFSTVQKITYNTLINTFSQEHFRVARILLCWAECMMLTGSANMTCDGRKIIDIIQKIFEFDIINVMLHKSQKLQLWFVFLKISGKKAGCQKKRFNKSKWNYLTKIFFQMQTFDFVEGKTSALNHTKYIFNIFQKNLSGTHSTPNPVEW